MYVSLANLTKIARVSRVLISLIHQVAKYRPSIQMNFFFIIIEIIELFDSNI
jgi:hypothetical protein